jgi:hypothetical protein
LNQTSFVDRLPPTEVGDAQHESIASMKALLAPVALAGLMISGVVAAQPPAASAPQAPTLVRGVVTAMTASTLSVKSRTGVALTLNLTPTWMVSVMKPVSIDAIQPGSFIGTAEMPQADGSGRSLEVHVFPPGMKAGEGHYAWDLTPGSMMTNGTVGKVAAGAHGRALDLSYPSGVRHIEVPADVPIVQITPGTQDLIKPGVSIFAIALQGPDGLITNAVATGEGGAAPPM